MRLQGNSLIFMDIPETKEIKLFGLSFKFLSSEEQIDNSGKQSCENYHI